MKYVITGSIGHISKPIVLKLVAAGHSVTVVTSKADKTKEIETLGAKAAVGSIEDLNFLKTTFAGSDVVYLMIPPKWTVTNWIEYQKRVADNYVEAVKSNHINYAVVLSSIGAHMRKGAGPIDGAAYLEEKLIELKEVNAKFLRPSYFYYNLFSMIPMIKQAGIMGSAQGPNHKLILTHTSDIAEVAAEELLSLDFKGQTVRNIASDERTWSDITNVLANAVGKPGIPYVEFTDEQSLQGMLQAGLSPTIAEGYLAMGKALRNGDMEADYWKNKPAQLGKVKLEEFAREFVSAYNAG
jgi:uncharacterized protein YbjT (DUF2867 family)